ncbi:unnamed protein product [Arctia plantaginis]|uniref:Peptidase S1 domain-containing protein n=1 Tax=Arctia plantaginis TaxID=874455 RepID=A0A8S1ALX7_ARCPL|nr:unnamed protein product [Arctia plantaginis]
MYIIYFMLVLVTSVCGQKEGDTCTDQYTTAAGICKPVEVCETAKQDLQESGIQPTFCSPTVSGNAVVCCRDGLKIFDTPATARTRDFPSWGFEEGKRISEKKCEEYSRGVVKRVDYLLLLVKPEIFSISVDKCDNRPVSLPAQIAELGEFPHMVALGWKDLTKKYKFKCGGSLISERFVLTVAQCSRVIPTKEDPPDSDQPVVVRLGDLNLDDSVKDGVTPVDVPIRHFHTHPDYRPPKRYNDIGLVELERDVEFNSYIRPACLWTSPDLSGYDKVITTGWSLINRNKTDHEKYLQKASINLIENNYCNSFITSKRMGLNDSQMCAGELNQEWDSCLNESGSPLQVASKENLCIFYVLGITSFGKPCATYTSPAVFTRVSSYLDWIEGIVWLGK